MNYYNFFGNEFDKLPLEIQKNIFLENTSHYQQIIADLLIQYNDIHKKYELMDVAIKRLQSEDGIIQYYLNMYENKHGYFNSREMNNAYKLLVNNYYPMIKDLRDKKKRYMDQMKEIKDSISENKKMYYYFYYKLKAIEKEIKKK